MAGVDEPHQLIPIAFDACAQGLQAVVKVALINDFKNFGQIKAQVCAAPERRTDDFQLKSLQSTFERRQLGSFLHLRPDDLDRARGVCENRL